MAQRFLLLAETPTPHAGSVAMLTFGTQDPHGLPICTSRDSTSLVATTTQCFVVLADSSATVDQPTITFGTLAPCRLRDPLVDLDQDGSYALRQGDDNMPCLAPTVTFGTLEPCPLYEPAVGFGAGSRYVSYPAFPRSVANPHTRAPSKQTLTFGTQDPCCLCLDGLSMGAFHAGMSTEGPATPAAPVDSLNSQPAHCLSTDDRRDDSTRARPGHIKANGPWKLASRVLAVVKSVITSFEAIRATTTNAPHGHDLGTWIETLSTLHAELSLHPWRLSTYVPTLVLLQTELNGRTELCEDGSLTILDNHASMLKALRRRYPRLRCFRSQPKP
ncbi:hypothetical protein SPRG_09622 [Saprolegnia parasitica CBS 223.65]|uniref:Uncharacterized protein n=1 Tax=Saprolegnia parasitica (strain CBS 223.65) TaxID=695850 RepID=A0A067CE00_SAPPC|nr:hypothetical protein SPRG_09622 [Saprolegnia parasitica CBS 223.65]KDO24761.1 hypothetical protein SPRG_09622 [Saprolegnia parasitica CBS 223.65]|eukprot:XP_012204438.1 hypothetical protein SPRG_09622 [Saprolegnia parasitica CBS 223.65]